MSTKAQNILKWFFIGFLTLIVSAIGIATMFEEKIGNAIIKAVNEEISSELTVEDFELSLLSSFPDASINLQKVMLKGAFGGVLMEAEEVAFKLGIFSLFANNLKVHSVAINEGSLKVKLDKRGRANYDILTKTDGEEGGDSGGISLEAARLEQVELIYEDENLKQTVLILVEEMNLSGVISGDKLAIESTADLDAHFIEIGDVRYLAGKKMV